MASAALRIAVFSLSGALLVFSVGVIVMDGHLPAAVPVDAPDYAVSDLMVALQHLDSQGRVAIASLRQDRAALDRFIRSMAQTAPSTAPSKFPTSEDKVAFWLNAYHALVLQQLLDTERPRSRADLSRFQSWPIGGQRLTRFAIERRFLSEAQDARVWLALFDGSLHGGVLDSAPFGGETLNPQLDERARRFFQRSEALVLKAGTVLVSPRVLAHHEAFVAALPSDRAHLLQVVWAYLPESCDGLRPGCDTRAELDRLCGPSLADCAIEALPETETLAFVPPMPH
jgi:hypothetical protein